MLPAWTAACAVAYLHGFGRRPAWVIAEFVVVAADLSTSLVASDAVGGRQPVLPTTLWATNATISAAILCGPVAGMLTGVAVMAVLRDLKGYVSFDLARNATLVIELAVGLAVGLAAQTARRAHAELERAARLSAAVAERERLARQVHDGVIQVLALVAKRGGKSVVPQRNWLIWPVEQESALRRLVSAEGMTGRPDTARWTWRPPEQSRR